MFRNGLFSLINRAAPLAQAIRPVLEGLEGRRLLSVEPGVVDPAEKPLAEEPLLEEWMELTIESDGSADEEVLEETGETYPEEWVYLTMVEDEGVVTLPPEDGSVVHDVEDGVVTITSDDGSVVHDVDGEVVFPDEGVDFDGDGEPDVIYLMKEGVEEVFVPDGTYTTDEGELIYYTMIEGDGNVLVPEEQDLDGDGIPDYIYYTTGGGDLGGDGDSAPTPFLHNGKLTILGTNGNDVINVKVIPGDPSAGLQVTINGEETIFLLNDIERIRILGGAGDDQITIDENVVIGARVQGQAGDDVIKSGAGDDIVGGGIGNDRLHGGKGQDRVRGHRGADECAGGAGQDEIAGGKGLDVVRGGAGDDALRGGKGKDRIRAGKGNDLMDGGAGRDRIKAGKGIDGCQDADGILDPDEDDGKIAEIRLAKPFWWAKGDGASNICLYDPENPGAECNDTPDTGTAPIWWEGDESKDDAGDQLPDGTGGGDDIQGIDVGEPYPDGSGDGDRIAYDPDKDGSTDEDLSDTEDPYAGLEDVTGILNSIFAIGGETPGYTVTTAEGKIVEVDLAGVEVPEGAEGSEVTVTGRFTQVEYVERGTVTIMVADGITVG